MNKIIDLINEHRWLKFIANLLTFSPMLSWIKSNLFKKTEDTMDSTEITNSIDVFGLITAIITTSLLLLILYLFYYMYNQLKIHKQISKLRNEQLYKCFINYCDKLGTNEGLISKSTLLSFDLPTEKEKITKYLIDKNVKKNDAEKLVKEYYSIYEL